MQITKTGIKPCSRCYKARQFAKDSIGRLVAKGEPANRLEVTTPWGLFIVETKDHTVLEAPGEWADKIGRKVYVAGRRLIDVEEAKPFIDVTRTRKYHV